MFAASSGLRYLRTHCVWPGDKSEKPRSGQIRRHLRRYAVHNGNSKTVFRAESGPRGRPAAWPPGVLAAVWGPSGEDEVERTRSKAGSAAPRWKRRVRDKSMQRDAGDLKRPSLSSCGTGARGKGGHCQGGGQGAAQDELGLEGFTPEIATGSDAIKMLFYYGYWENDRGRSRILGCPQHRESNQS